MAMNETVAGGWENHKENAAPLQRGRSVSILETEISQSEKERQIREFEEQLTASNNNDLTTWVEYIKWYQEHFPSETHNSFLLFERCVRYFYRVEEYLNDPRFVRVCCLYADQTREPLVTFQELYRAGIGHQSATFWNAWAFFAEKSQDFRMAEKIFVKALQKGAQPVDYLLLRQKRFQRRMSRHFLNSIDDVSSEEVDDQREALNSLSIGDVAANHRRGTATAGLPASQPAFSIRSQRRPPASNNGVASFTIYQPDAPSTHDDFEFLERAGPGPEREPEFERWKENRGKKEKWNDRKHGPVVPYVPTAQDAFSIHLDEECAAQHARDEEECQRRLNLHREARDERQSGAHRKRKVRHMWRDDLLVGSNGDEQCFEEARMVSKSFKLLPAGTCLNLIFSTGLDEDSDMSLSIDETCLDTDKPLEKTSKPQLDTVNGNLALHFETKEDAGNGNLTTPRNGADLQNMFPAPTPQNTSTNSSLVEEVARVPAEPTINTQLALKELSVMFLSPAVDRDDDRAGVGGSILDESAVHGSCLQNSIFHEVEQENKDLATNPFARTNETHGFGKMALKDLKQDDGTTTRCSTQSRIGRIDQSNPLSGLREDHEMDPDPGFVIFADEDQQQPGPSFSIFEDDGQPDHRPRNFTQERNIGEC